MGEFEANYGAQLLKGLPIDTEADQLEVDSLLDAWARPAAMATTDEVDDKVAVKAYVAFLGFYNQMVGKLKCGKEVHIDFKLTYFGINLTRLTQRYFARLHRRRTVPCRSPPPTPHSAVSQGLHHVARYRADWSCFGSVSQLGASGPRPGRERVRFRGARQANPARGRCSDRRQDGVSEREGKTGPSDGAVEAADGETGRAGCACFAGRNKPMMLPGRCCTYLDCLRRGLRRTLPLGAPT